MTNRELTRAILRITHDPTAHRSDTYPAIYQLLDRHCIDSEEFEKLKQENRELYERLAATELPFEETYRYLEERDELLNRQFADSSDPAILAEQERVAQLMEGLR